MLRKLALVAGGIVIIALAAFWIVTMPQTIDAATMAAMKEGDAKRGERIFWAGGCASCHAAPGAQDEARKVLSGGLDKSKWLAGALSPETGSDGKKGIVPNITTGPGGIGDWSAQDIAYALQSGFTPDFDSLGGSMTDVVANMAKLPDEDRQAIAAYLKVIPPHPDGFERH